MSFCQAKLFGTDSVDNQMYIFCLPTPVAVETPLRAAGIALAVRPNPSHGEMRISFRLPTAASVQVRVFDSAGRLVRVVAGGELPAGEYSLEWDGRDAAGRSLSSGVYFVHASGPGFQETRRAVLLR